MEYILGIILLYIILDIYYKFIQYRRRINLITLQEDMVNKVLITKEIITTEELNLARKEILGNLYIEDYKKIKKDLRKMGVDIDK